MSAVTSTMILDAKMRPDSFDLGWKPSRLLLQKWLYKYQSNILNEIYVVWSTVGGGDFFETETLLIPKTSDSANRWETIDEVSSFFYTQGLSRNCLILHRGLYYTILDLDLDRIDVCRDLNFISAYSYNTFEQWYQFIRKIYFTKYLQAS